MSVTNPNGHVKIHRQIENSQVWRNAELLKVWLWCLLRASYKERWVDAKTGKGITQVHVMPGQFIFGRFEAADALRQKPSSVRNRMEKLSKMGNLALKPDTHWTLVTVCNWDRYQAKEAEGGQASGQATDTQRTGKGQPKDTNKKGKKVEVGKEEKKPLAELPEELDTPEFQKAWADWAQHRRETRKTMTPLAAKKLLNKLTGWGAARAVVAIDHSIASGYQGIFEPKGGNGQAAGPTFLRNDDHEGPMFDPDDCVFDAELVHQISADIRAERAEKAAKEAAGAN